MWRSMAVTAAAATTVPPQRNAVAHRGHRVRAAIDNIVMRILRSRVTCMAPRHAMRTAPRSLMARRCAKLARGTRSGMPRYNTAA